MSDYSRGNDSVRAGLPFVTPPNTLVISCGISSLHPRDIARIIDEVKLFDAFNESNDPFHQHDFGSFGYDGEKVCWKIDDYAGIGGIGLVITIMLEQER